MKEGGDVLVKELLRMEIGSCVDHGPGLKSKHGLRILLGKRMSFKSFLGEW